MILSMNSQDLLEGLNIVTRALSSRPAKQILEGVLISAEEKISLSDQIVVEDQQAAQQEEKAEASEKARENIIKISSSKDSVREMTKQRAEKYKINEISTEDAVTIGPTTGPTAAGMDENLGYYVGGPSQPIYMDPEAVGAEYLGEWEITAYCACVLCCDKSDGITASGAMVQANHTIAAPKEFKFGTKMLVGGQLYTVEDRGGGIHGNRIDIYFNSHEQANDFGVRYMDVYLVPQ